MTRFMQDADVFEEFKVVVKPLLIADVVDDFGPKDVARMVEIADPAFPIVAVFDKDTVYYRDESVKAISTAEQWCLLDDFINRHQRREEGP